MKPKKEEIYDAGFAEVFELTHAGRSSTQQDLVLTGVTPVIGASLLTARSAKHRALASNLLEFCRPGWSRHSLASTLRSFPGCLRARRTF